MVFSRIKAQTLNFWTVALQEGGHIFVVVHLLCMQQIPGSRSGIATKDSNWPTGLKGLKEPGFFLPRLALAHCPLPSLTSFCFFFPGQMCFLCIGFPGSILTWSVSSLLLPVKGKRSLYCQSPCPVPFSCYLGLPLNIFYSGLHRVQDWPCHLTMALPTTAVPFLAHSCVGVICLGPNHFWPSLQG